MGKNLNFFSVGVLLMAHGGSAKWDQEIYKVQKQLQKAGYVTEVAMGMADVTTLQKALDRLQSKKPDGIICVPLLVSSSSELYEQFEYVLGLRQEPSKDFLDGMRAMGDMSKHWGSMASKEEHEKSERYTIKMLWEKKHHEHAPSELRQVETKNPGPEVQGPPSPGGTRGKLFLTSALDSHPLVAAILLDRAKKLSQNPAQEVVVLVSHGPYTDAREVSWMKMADALASEVQKLGNFAQAKAFDLRDDSPQEVKKKKEAELRKFISDKSRAGFKVIVLLHLVAANGIESHIRRALDGLFYKMSKEGLLPHANIGKWSLEMVQKTQQAISEKRK